MSVEIDFTLDLRAASLQMKMPQRTVLKCVSYQARKNGGVKLHTITHDGKNWFRQSDIDAYLADLENPWVDGDDEKKPAIPDFFKQYLELETRLRCGVCGKQYATDFAHITAYKECKHNHPWNLLCVCSDCHTGYDVEKRISRDEVAWAKRRAEKTFREFLAHEFDEARLLDRLKQFRVPMNGTYATGIDFLMSMIVPSHEVDDTEDPHLELTKLRVVSTLRMLGDESTQCDPMGTLVRLTELSLSHLATYLVTIPFWEHAAETIYENEFYPEQKVVLNVLGESMIKYLLNHADQYVEPAKYPRYSKFSPRELLDSLISEVTRLQRRRDASGKMGSLDLNDWSA